MTVGLRTRHIAILTYAAISIMAIFKGIVTTPENIIAILAPIAGMFVWDKLKGNP